MRAFFERWYGDRCPFWTWPATVCTFVVIGLTVAFAQSMGRQWACEAMGGNVSKPSGCYLVTERKIDAADQLYGCTLKQQAPNGECK
jgi:hypothetical protein